MTTKRPLPPAVQAGLDAGYAKQLALREARETGEPTRWEMYKAGDLKVADLDNEEIASQRFRDRLGGFVGRPPLLSGKQQQEFRRELLKRGQRKLDGMYEMALGVLKEIAASGMAEDKDRLKATDMIMQRVAGKVPERVELGPVDAFSGFLEGIIDDAVKDAPGDEA